MRKKITTMAQVSLLQEGDVLERFPCNCDDGPAQVFDDSRERHIIRYKVQAINVQTRMFYMTSGNFGTTGYLAPVDIGRLFIRDTDIIAENTWWINI